MMQDDILQAVLKDTNYHLSLFGQDEVDWLSSSVTQEDMAYPINSSQDVAKIITTPPLIPCYLSIFLQSHYGRIQTSRLPIGSVQQHIFLWQINNLVILLFGKAFQSSAEDTYREALSLLKQADVAYEFCLLTA